MGKKGEYKLDKSQWDINDLLQDFKEDTSIWSEEDQRVRILKRIINRDLNEIEKRVILLYVDAGSLRAAAEVLDVSAPTFRSYLLRVKKKIKECYDKYSSDNDDCGSDI